ncbi:MAG: threonylcarbamoyl-AMP synthase [Acidobacteria bacterium]|nr:threonylcarbamoyl-AMP synthase [Acidobacteriota bacterium]
MNNCLLTLEIDKAAQTIKNGGVVAFPTDTFYGLGCDPFNASSVEKIYQLKNRPSYKAILLLISSLEGLDKCIVLEKLTKKQQKYFQILTTNFWPGPLTIVLPASDLLPKNLVSTENTVGIRYPNYELAQRLTKAVGGAITATSANLSGQPNVETASEVFLQLGNRLDYILDGGKSPGGKPSSVIDLTIEPPNLVREGAISQISLMTLLENIG